jgi:hypothetical protein
MKIKIDGIVEKCGESLENILISVYRNEYELERLKKEHNHSKEETILMSYEEYKEILESCPNELKKLYGFN